MSDRTKLTLPVGLAVLGGGNYVQRGLTMAAAVIATTPPLILYVDLPAPDHRRNHADGHGRAIKESHASSSLHLAIQTR